MEDFLLDTGEGKEQTPAAGATPPLPAMEDSGRGKEQTPAAGATPPSVGKLLHQFAFGMAAAVATVFGAFVIHASATYTHSWIEKLQMIPLCIVAVTAPMLCIIMIPKRQHLRQRRHVKEWRTEYAASGAS